ncbi:MAG: hypothetical protein H7235_09680, partial [Bdellovibrionaceae bacterium]|nr:hypothetical protein [Pseudobdellovibrionaceae bacterium]
MKNSVSIWYAVILSMTLTSCFQTKDGKPAQAIHPDKPIIVPEVNPSGQTVSQAESPTEPKFQATTKDQSKLACIQSLCGTEYVLTPEYVKHPAVLEEKLKVIENKLGRTIELKMGQSIKNHMTAGDALKAISPNKIANIEFTREQIGFLNAFKYLNQIKSYYSSLE